jgi:DNA (cytosine-5)-methyltransferase 1
MKVLDLFSGIGGFSLGLERAGMETVAFCEIDPFCQKVLKKHWPDVPIFEDVRELDYDGPVDLICGGYPCQPFSTAGKRKGEEDDRHLWPAMFNLIKKHRPAWVIGENVAGHINMGLDNVLSDLGNENYATRAFVLPACSINAPHRRDRVWIVANSKGKQRNVNENVNDREMSRKELWGDQSGGRDMPSTFGLRFKSGGGEVKPFVCGVNDGFSLGVDRLRALGNAVVPQIPEIIGRAIMEAT